MTKIAAVSGANGFLGAHLVRKLLAEGWHVRVLLRKGSDDANLQGLPVEVRRGDLTNEPFLAAALAGTDWFFHLAALYTQDPARRSEMYRVNTDWTRQILQAAASAGCQRIVHTSTIGVIGQPRHGLANETTPYNLDEQASDYVKSKYRGEQAALALADAGAPIVVVNPCAPVGAFDRTPTVTGQRIVQVLQRRVPSFPPGGINFVPARDVATGMFLAAERGHIGQRYILGHREGNFLLADFLAMLATTGGVRLRPPGSGWRVRMRRWLHGRPTAGPRGSAPLRLTANPAKAIRELQMPQSDLHEAFTEAVTWFCQQGIAQKIQNRHGPMAHHSG